MIRFWVIALFRRNSNTNTDETNITLFLLNIQCIRNKTDELYILLESLAYPSIVLITEHWLKTNEPLCIPNYSVLSKYSRINFAHGGTLILINNRLQTRFPFINCDTYDDALEEKQFEFSIIFCSEINMYIVCVYRSPLSDVNLFLSKLESLLFRLPEKSSVVLTGDFNINFDNKDANDTQLLINLLTSMNINMHVNSHTRVSQYSATTIDYFCTNLNKQNISCSVISAGLSDHEVVYCTVQLESSILCQKHKFGRLFSKTNYNSFFQIGLDSDWDELLNEAKSI